MFLFITPRRKTSITGEVATVGCPQVLFFTPLVSAQSEKKPIGEYYSYNGACSNTLHHNQHGACGMVGAFGSFALAYETRSLPVRDRPKNKNLKGSCVLNNRNSEQGTLSRSNNYVFRKSKFSFRSPFNCFFLRCRGNSAFLYPGQFHYCRRDDGGFLGTRAVTVLYG